MNDSGQSGKKTQRKGKTKSGLFKFFFLIIGILIIAIIFKGLYSDFFVNDDNDIPQILLSQNNREIADNSAYRDNWELILVNKDHPVPDNYIPTLKKVSDGQYVDERIYPALTKMLEAAEKAGHLPIIAAGYRTMEKQEQLMQERIDYFKKYGYSEAEAKQKAESWVAIPGTSEHQLGLAVDINGRTYDIYTWLEENSYKYGFIKRYPEDKTDITGVMNEPWHFRYVGIEAATEIYEQNICLEEYLNMQQPF